MSTARVHRFTTRWCGELKAGMIALLLAGWSVGCGEPEPTIDASSERRFQESIEVVRESLPMDQRGRFDQALERIKYAWIRDMVGSGWENTRRELARAAWEEKHRWDVEQTPPPRSEVPERVPEPVSLFQTLDGMTGRQVIAAADSIQRGGSASGPGG